MGTSVAHFPSKFYVSPRRLSPRLLLPSYFIGSTHMVQSPTLFEPHSIHM
jgi:hypothetical protein